LLEYTVLS